MPLAVRPLYLVAPSNPWRRLFRGAPSPPNSSPPALSPKGSDPPARCPCPAGQPKKVPTAKQAGQLAALLPLRRRKYKTKYIELPLPSSLQTPPHSISILLLQSSLLNKRYHTTTPLSLAPVEKHPTCSPPTHRRCSCFNGQPSTTPRTQHRHIQRQHHCSCCYNNHSFYSFLFITPASCGEYRYQTAAERAAQCVWRATTGTPRPVPAPSRTFLAPCC